MTVKRRPQLWTRVVPGGWKVISLRQGATINPFYLSPDGKRFASLEAVKVHVASARAELSDAEMDAEGLEVKKKKRRKRKRQATAEEAPSEPVAKKLKFDDLEDDKTKAPLSLPIEIQKRRKLLAARSPFRNLLKKTLVRNHIRMRGKLPFMIPGHDFNSLKRPAAVLDDKTEPSSSHSHSSPSKRQKTIHGSPTKRVRTSDDSSSIDGKISEESSEDQGTPPRPLFPPPNLTPPVAVRRAGPGRLSFASPNMRSVVSRVRLTKPHHPATSGKEAKSL